MTATPVSDAAGHLGAIIHFSESVLSMTATFVVHSDAVGQYPHSFLDMTLLTPPVNRSGLDRASELLQRAGNMLQHCTFFCHQHVIALQRRNTQ